MFFDSHNSVELLTFLPVCIEHSRENAMLRKQKNTVIQILKGFIVFGVGLLLVKLSNSIK